MIGRLLGAAAIAAAAIGLVGCGEQPQVVRYKQGIYQGKPDTKPWVNPPFAGNKAEWERAIKQRNEAQNEYRRAS